MFSNSIVSVQLVALGLLLAHVGRAADLRKLRGGEVLRAPSNDLGSNAVSGPLSLSKMEPEAIEKDESGMIDSLLGEGTQSRIAESVNSWIQRKAKETPGCIERFVCETYRSAESLSGIPYILMQISNAAAAFTVAQMFEDSVNVREITRAARYGRTVGSCDVMKCDYVNGQLRTLGDYLGSMEDMLTSIFSSVSNSINLG